MPTAEEMASFLKFIRVHYPGSLQHAFQQIDLFKSGKISHIEFKTAAKFYKGDIGPIFRALDVGKTANLTEAEFMLLEAVQFVRYLRQHNHKDLAEVFRQLDVMGNGI